MISRDKRLRICLILLVLNLCFIWGNSLLSAERSQAFSDFVLELLPGQAEGAAGSAGESGTLRKIAHFTEFTALGLLLSWLSALLRKKKWLPLFGGALAACIDETIQIFVPGRGPGLLDVGIDICGAATGMLLLQIGYLILRRIYPTQYGGKQ